MSKILGRGRERGRGRGRSILYDFAHIVEDPEHYPCGTVIEVEDDLAEEWIRIESRREELMKIFYKKASEIRGYEL